MRIKKVTLFCLYLFTTSGIMAQPGITIKKKFFTLRNARLNVGINVSANFIYEDDNYERQNIFNYHTNDFPQEYGINYLQEDNPYTVAGLLFDLFSPNSVLGLSFGAEYNFLKFGVDFNDSPISAVQMQQVRFPAYLKFQTGTVHDKISGVLMAGGYYNLPVKYQRNGLISSSNNVNDLNEFIGLSLILGFQTRFFNEGNREDTNAKFSRSWLFLRGDYAFSDSSLTTTALQEMLLVPLSDAQQYAFNPLVFSIGLGYFF